MRKKKKPVTLAALRPGVEIGPAEVDDPYNAGETIVVMRNLKVSPLMAIFARGRLKGPGDDDDDARARLIAGERLRATYEAAEMRSSKAIDYSQPKVDVSFAYRGMGEKQIDALKSLAEARISLGASYLALDAIVCREVRFMAFCEAHIGPQAGPTARLNVYAHIRDSLDLLILFYGPAVGVEKRVKALA